MKNWIVIALLIIVSACGEKESGEEETVTVASLKDKINAIDDSLVGLTADFLDGKIEKIDRLVYHEAINRNIDFYNHFPENEFAPFALEKVSSMYMSLKVEDKAADWRDTILINYPDFKRTLDILELQKAYYDGYDNFEQEKVEEYTKRMLERDDLTDEKRADLEFRLEHIDKSFKELIKISNPELDI